MLTKFKRQSLNQEPYDEMPPPPLEIPIKYCTFLINILVLGNPHPPGISQSLLLGEYGY